MSSKNDDLYKDLPNRISTVMGDYMRQLRQVHDARIAYMADKGLHVNESISVDELNAWLEEHYGVKLKYNTSNDGITGLVGYDVIDEQKFLVFCLKFS